jgi:hypothetical protein
MAHPGSCGERGRNAAAQRLFTALGFRQTMVEMTLEIEDAAR